MRKIIAIFLALAIAMTALPAFAKEASDDDGTKAEQQDKKKAKEKKKREPLPPQSNLPLNFYGRNGLILTSSTHVLEAKDVEPGIAYMYESSGDPEYIKHVMAVNLAVGLPRNVMLYGHAPYIFTDLQYGETFNALKVRVRDFTQKEQNGFGSVEAGLTWAFFMQDRFLPAMSAGFSFLAPTGDYTQRMSEVKYIGFKLNVAMSLEVFDLFFTDYAFAIMADGSFVFRDPWFDGQEYEEKHGLVHAGMIFPLHPRNFLNLIIEYDGLLMRGTSNTDDHNGVLGGLRFIMDNVGLTTGAEYLLLEAEDMNDTWRVIGNFSYRFW